MSHVRFEEIDGGAVALRDGDEVARLTGELRDHEVLGRQAWIAAGGDATLFAGLYALAAAPWVADGYVSHQVEVAADDEAGVAAWFALCFGRQQVYAEQPVRPGDASSQALVRPGTPDDAAALGDLIAQLQVGPPVWSGFPPRPPETVRELWEAELDDPDLGVLLAADLDGRPAGLAAFYRVDAEEANLAVAATRPEVRGRGVGLALFEAGMCWAHEHGYRRLSADWRSTNPLASRFWTARGFRPVRYRLHRFVAR